MFNKLKSVTAKARTNIFKFYIDNLIAYDIFELLKQEPLCYSLNTKMNIKEIWNYTNSCKNEKDEATHVQSKTL